jgi:glycosyltransferase involved in cell wall biosynthesis
MTGAHVAEQSCGHPRLLFVVNHAGFFMSHRLALAQAARDAGYEVHVATPNSKHVAQLQGSGIVWHEWRLSRSGLNPLAEWRSFRDLCRLYRSLRPDLVHHVTSKPVLYGTAAARATGVPAVVNAISGMGHAFAEGGGLMRRLLRKAVSLGYRIALRHPRMRVIVQNSEHRQHFERQPWIQAGDVILIRGAGVDVANFTPRLMNFTGPVRIVLAARLIYTKGVGQFVAAARLLKQRGLNATYALVGEPDADNPASIPLEVLRQWHAEGIVDYRGRQEDMQSVFADTDIVCLPTYYSEGIPKVLVEAAACGLPIVSTDWPGCREIVQHGHNGLLVPIKDPEALAQALAALINDASLRRQMGELGRARAVGDYSLDAVIRQTLAIYQNLLSRLAAVDRTVS